MGGKPNRGTSADRRLKANQAKAAPAPAMKAAKVKPAMVPVKRGKR